MYARRKNQINLCKYFFTFIWTEYGDHNFIYLINDWEYSNSAWKSITEWLYKKKTIDTTKHITTVC